MAKSKKTTAKNAQAKSAPLVTDFEAVWAAMAERTATIIHPPSPAAGWWRRLGIDGWFAIGALVVLAVTSLFWTVLGARLNQANADQLIDTYLFETNRTFQAAGFPGAHSFLLKWPLFALTAWLGGSTGAIMAGTIIAVGLTLGVLVLILHRIERRPLYFGLLCLGLSSVLLLVPAQPYPGALLPVNLAMITTRNLEYVVYVAVLATALRIRRFKSWQFVAATVLLALLIASDKLFAVLAIGGIALYGAVNLRRSAWLPQVAPLFRLVSMAVVATALATAGLFIVSKAGITHIVDEANSSPFSTIGSIKQLAEGLVYAGLALLTNSGTNPIHATTVIADIPRTLLTSLRQASIIAYGINLLVLVFSLRAAWRIWSSRSDDGLTKLGRLLIGSTVAAIVVFVLTDHYYPVDARYLTIGLFALTIAAAWELQTISWPRGYIAATAGLLSLAIIIGLGVSTGEYHASQTALSDRKAITSQVAEKIEHNNIDRLIGNYWDVTPVKAATGRRLTIAPVNNCTTPQTILNSRAWTKAPAHTATAYLAIRDTDNRLYDGCTIQHIVASYGVPNERIPLSQSLQPDARPAALLLLYPGGTTTAKATTPPVPTPAAVETTPELTSLSNQAVCSSGTSLTVVAHEDDDILFTNPDLSGEITAGHCMRTVYLTAGDAGENYNYWHGRESGAEAAYARMYNVDNSWTETTVLLDGHLVTVATLQNVPNVSLVFLRLPDGNLKGEGFAATAHESLAKLSQGSISTLHSVDSRSKYTAASLTAMLTALMKLDMPSTIRTQGYIPVNNNDADHSDHLAAGLFTNRARQNYGEAYAYNTYAGYPEKELVANVSDSDFDTKQAAFLEYARYDGAVCHTASECATTYTYGSYLARMYKHTEQLP